MEHESLDYKIVMDDGPDTEVLGRLASLDIASVAYRQTLVKNPPRNVSLHQAARSSSNVRASRNRSCPRIPT